MQTTRRGGGCLAPYFFLSRLAGSGCLEPRCASLLAELAIDNWSGASKYSGGGWNSSGRCGSSHANIADLFFAIYSPWPLYFPACSRGTHQKGTIDVRCTTSFRLIFGGVVFFPLSFGFACHSVYIFSSTQDSARPRMAQFIFADAVPKFIG